MQEITDYESTRSSSPVDEPLLRDNPNRFVLMPIQYPDIY